MINLEKELVQKNETRKAKLEKLDETEEMKLLMEHMAGEERNVLRHFNLDENVQKVEALRGQMLESEKFTEEYGNSYQYNDIAFLALQYRLRFLPLVKFKGGIDPLLATKMVSFGKKHNADPIAYADNYYVLAPAEDFALETEKHHRPRPIVAQDPLLFYRTDREGHNWTLVHKWGTEFNYLRMINAFKYRNSAYYVGHWAIVFSAILMVAFCALIGGYTVPMWSIALISSVIGTIASFIKYGCLNEADEKNLFTETNWTDSRHHIMVNWDQ